jgi:hypothetical protein
MDARESARSGGALECGDHAAARGYKPCGLTAPPSRGFRSSRNWTLNSTSRLVRAFPVWPNVRLWALEPHDLALTKLERSIERDIRDVIFLAQAGLIDRDTLVARFEAELEPYITGRTATWHRTTLKMWIEACWP